MKNWEFHREGLEKYFFVFGMKQDNKMCWCSEMYCNECIFNKKNPLYGCNKTKIEWLYQEHKEPVVLTDDEKALCKLLNKNGYIARDSNNKLFYYPVKPHKNNISWGCEHDKFIISINDSFPTCKFDFIKWEDEEPWEVKIND